ncbi:MAG TPA: glycosyl hydrolase [Actinomycetota bacterium]|nr:glycosyl hydrolase [Actinomycetota bacterium]
MTDFRDPDRRFGILPFWFLNGELDPDEMRWQLGQLREKGMQGVIFHGRYGLEMPYLGPTYLERIRLGVEEASRLDLATWIYDEMNWPSGTADKRVLRERPDLAQRYIECVSFSIDGPWFMCLTGEDSRYLDFEGSTPVAAFAIGPEGRTVDLTPNLSFGKVVPWEVPPGSWQLTYVVEKRADYYIDAMDPEATTEFLRLGYAPYAEALGPLAERVTGFYSDEPAMHYYLTARDNPVVPWTKDMFGRFRDRNGYDLRPRLADLFFDASPDSARVRFDYYSTTTEFYTEAYYRQIHEWCRAHGFSFVAHLLYEEWLRQMIRVEGNLFRHYRNMDVVGVDHLYPVIGTREHPDQHVAMKVASSAAHHYGTERVLCESFGGIFMDTTMQRMKWIADWECVLGVNIVNPHGFHYTLEGARKRDWPPSQFYQYPWWRYYEHLGGYVTRVCEMLTGGRHVAKVAVLWPINAMFATYTPQTRNALGDRIEFDTNVLTDQLLRLHHDFDYLDEDVLAGAEVADGRIRVADETYEVLVLPPLAHLKLGTVEALERLVGSRGRALGMVFLPDRAFAPEGGLVDVGERLGAIFGVDPAETQASFATSSVELVETSYEGGGLAAFLRAPALDGSAGSSTSSALRDALGRLIEPDVEIDNEELFVLHRVKDGRDRYFVTNPTFEPQAATLRLPGEVDAVLRDPALGEEQVAPSELDGGRTVLHLELGPVGSTFIVAEARSGRAAAAPLGEPSTTIALDGEWNFEPADPNALVIERWLATPEEDGAPPDRYAGADVDVADWQTVTHGAWAYQLPSEPSSPWPIPVWYRVSFSADHEPASVQLVVDGFAGMEPAVYLNGERATAEAVRSPFDSQMTTIDLTEHVRVASNVLAIRLVLRSATDGITDRIKLIGRFSVARGEDGAYGIVRPVERVKAAPWTDQGYPFLSGVGVYRTSASLPDELDGRRVFLEASAGDDVLEVVVNGTSAGVRLWPPYSVEVTDQVHGGENEIELRVANTLANLLNAEERASGIAEAPRLVVHG